MVEVELKYEIKKVSSNIDNYELEKEKLETDLYFDTNNYDLIKNGNFLRLRNKHTLDFKLNIGDKEHLYCKETNFSVNDISSDNEDFTKVFDVIGIKINFNYKNFDELIKSNDFILLATIKKHRRVYKILDDIRIIIDEIDNLGTFLEAEMMVEEEMIDELYIRKCKGKLISILEENNLISKNDKQVKIGYVELLLQKYNPLVYEMGIFKEN